MKKTQKFSEIIVLLHSHSQRFFANVCVRFSNINNRRVTSAHVATLLSFMQLIEEYMLAIKDEMNVARGLKLHDFILSFILLSRTNVGSKTFFLS